MDRILYTAAGGAARTLEAQAALTNNLANANTPGFRAQVAATRAVPVAVPGQLQPGTRVLSAATTADSVFTPGAIRQTGRVLDVAIVGSGWIAVQTPQGEAYTRAGSLKLDPAGQLTVPQGFPVLGANGGAITVPPAAHLHVTRHGAINMIPEGGKARDLVRLGSLKFVNPDPRTLVRGDDGLFRAQDAQGQPVDVPADPRVEIQDRALEDSNVEPTAQMVGLIENARRFQMQMSIVKQASSNAQDANSILSVNAN